MFLPSLFTGDLIKKFGHNIIIVTGVFYFSEYFYKYFIQTYFRLRNWFNFTRVGWNFLFLCSSALLVVSYKPEDKYVLKDQQISLFLLLKQLEV